MKRELSFLSDWPVAYLSKTPRACVTKVYGPGEVVEAETLSASWVYIVRKGRVSVLKKLRHAAPTIHRPRMRKSNGEGSLRYIGDLDPPMLPASPTTADLPVYKSEAQMMMKLEENIPGVYNKNDRLGVIDYDAILERHRRRMRQVVSGSRRSSSRLPAIDRNAKQTEEKQGAYLSTASSNVDDTSPGSDDNISSGVMSPGAHCRLQSVNRIPETEAIGPSRSEVRFSDHVTRTTRDLKAALSDVIRPERGRCIKRRSRGQRGKPPSHTFIKLRTLHAGEQFGLSDVIQGQGDPGISLVSEGSATIILLSKMHFLQQASATLMTSLRSKMDEHQSEEELQRRLQQHVDWQAYRQRSLVEVMRAHKLKLALNKRGKLPPIGHTDSTSS